MSYKLKLKKTYYLVIFLHSLSMHFITIPNVSIGKGPELSILARSFLNLIDLIMENSGASSFKYPDTDIADKIWGYYIVSS